jgi:hypothetical protein
MDDDDYTRITLRIPKNLHQKLTEVARGTSKSMNAEIVARLEKSFQLDEIDKEFNESIAESQRIHRQLEGAYTKLTKVHANLLNIALGIIRDATKTMRRHNLPDGDIKHIEATWGDLTEMFRNLQEGGKT